MNEPLPPAFQEAFDVFRSIPRPALVKQQELREIVLDTEKMYHELTAHYLITEEFFIDWINTWIDISIACSSNMMSRYPPTTNKRRFLGDDDHKQGRFGGSRG